MINNSTAFYRGINPDNTTRKQLTVRLSRFVIAVASILFLLTQPLLAQTVTIRGKVTDAKTNEAVLFANVQIVGTTTGTQTDLNGAYALNVKPGSITLKFSYVGYTAETRTLTTDSSKRIWPLNIRLKPQANSLDEVTVRGKKDRYRNRDNPAVALIEKVIANKGKNRRESFDFYQYNKYEKIEFDLSNVSDKFRSRRSLKKFDFVFNYLDTSQVTGKVNLPMYLKESAYDVYYRKSPEKKREVLQGERTTGIGGYVDGNGIKSYLETLYQDVNIYDGQILLLAQQFLGPTSPLAPQFYKYVIVDTTDIKGIKCVNLGFSPRNKTDLLFQGTMAIALDSSYAIRKVEMGFAKDININYVTDLRISQEYDQVDGQEGLMLTKDELAIEFNLLKKDNGMGLFGQRSVSYNDYRINKPIDGKLLTGLANDEVKEALNRDEAYWGQARHRPLSAKEQGIYTMVDSIKNVPLFRKVVNTALFLAEGYKPIGGFEIGPVNTFYSFNPVEGLRLRAGGRTTAAFSERLALEGYGAYGFRDKQVKYYGSASWSLTDHNVYTYPVKRFRASYQHEIRIPGQELQFIQESNFLLSFKRGQNNRFTYNSVWNIDYLNESKSGLALSVSLRGLQQEPAGILRFDAYTGEDELRPVKSINTTELTVGLRYAPHEQFYQGKTYRVPIVNKYPVFQVRYTTGVKDLLGGDYSFQRVTGYANKRFFVVPIGFTDVSLEGGATLGKVPFPLLTIHRANQTYAYQPESYNMMNFMEFISDHYATVFVDHHFNGAIFNRLPLIKKLKLRELITFKSLWGGISPDNRPTPENGLLRLPIDPATGLPISYALGKTPYMEASIGIANIFKVLRIDFVKRLSYLENPNAPKGVGIRFRMKFDF